MDDTINASRDQSRAPGPLAPVVVHPPVTYCCTTSRGSKYHVGPLEIGDSFQPLAGRRYFTQFYQFTPAHVSQTRHDQVHKTFPRPTLSRPLKGTTQQNVSAPCAESYVNDFVYPVHTCNTYRTRYWHLRRRFGHQAHHPNAHGPLLRLRAREPMNTSTSQMQCCNGS